MSSRSTVKLPFIKWRDGRPRLVHGPRERASGFEDCDLRHVATGAWFSYEEAKAFADKHLDEIKRSRQAAPRKIKAPSLQRAGTVEDLLDDWLASPEVTNLKPASVASYRKAARALIYRPESRTDAKTRRQRERAAAVLGATMPGRDKEQLANMLPAAIGAPELRALFNYLKGVRGHHMALGTIAALSAALTWGKESSKWRLKDNPRIDMQFDRPAGRIVMIEFEEFAALVKAADAMGHPSIGDAIYLGLFTGQRQADRLKLKDDGMVNGRRQLKQSKTGMIVAIKEAPQLAARLADAKLRVAKLKVKLGLRDMPETIVVDETTGRHYNEHTYRHLFAEIRDLALKGSNDLGLPTCPSLQFVNENTGAVDYKHDQDLRDTCVMLLDRAGNDLLSICDVTGHSYQSAQMIMKHYRARNAARADAAIDKLVSFLKTEGL